MKLDELERGKRYLVENHRGELAEIYVIEKCDGAVKIQYAGKENHYWMKESELKYSKMFAALPESPEIQLLKAISQP